MGVDLTFPADLADAKSLRSLTANPLFSKQPTISSPTAPVAPTMPTLSEKSRDDHHQSSEYLMLYRWSLEHGCPLTLFTRCIRDVTVRHTEPDSTTGPVPSRQRLAYNVSLQYTMKHFHAGQPRNVSHDGCVSPQFRKLSHKKSDMLVNISSRGRRSISLGF